MSSSLHVALSLDQSSSTGSIPLKRKDKEPSNKGAGVRQETARVPCSGQAENAAVSGPHQDTSPETLSLREPSDMSANTDLKAEDGSRVAPSPRPTPASNSKDVLSTNTGQPWKVVVTMPPLPCPPLLAKASRTSYVSNATWPRTRPRPAAHANGLPFRSGTILVTTPTRCRSPSTKSPRSLGREHGCRCACIGTRWLRDTTRAIPRRNESARPISRRSCGRCWASYRLGPEERSLRSRSHVSTRSSWTLSTSNLQTGYITKLLVLRLLTSSGSDLVA